MLKKIYILTRLFNVNDRIASLELCNYIDKRIETNDLIGYDLCFLPYRDSNEKVANLDNKTYEIFRMDCETIRQADVILGYVDGPVYDSGIGFEIGYAYTMGIPVILVTTDYFKFLDGNELYSISPIASEIAKILHIRENSKKSLSYYDSLQDIRQQVYDKLLLEIKSSCKGEGINNNKVPLDYDYFIDPEFQSTEAGRKLLDDLKVKFGEKNNSYICCSSKDLSNAGKVTELLKRSKNILLFGDGFEININTAIIQGIAYGLGKNILLYSSTSYKLYQTDDFILYKNPMIEHSAARIISSIMDI